jgi:membrane-associated protein
VTGTLVAPLLLGMSWMSPDWLLQQFGQTLLWVSLLVIFIECGLLFPFLPGDTLLFAMGLFIATQDISVTGNRGVDLVIALAAFSGAAFLGNVTGYEIGRRAGPRLTGRDGRFLTTRRLEKTHAFFEQHGDRALLIGRFVPFVRTFVTLVAGVAVMDRRRFLLWSGIGAVAWVASITLLGYFLGDTVPRLKDNIDYAVLAILLFSALPAAFHWLRRRRAREA